MNTAGLLAPILLLTTVVERVMEAVWGAWERVKVLAAETLIRSGNNQAEKDKLARDPDYARKLVLDNEPYKRRKRVLTLIAGSLAGMFLSVVTGVRFFEMTFAVLQIPQPVILMRGADLSRLFDIVITGLAIGSGSQPVHALISWISFAQSVQKELAELRRSERSLSDVHLLNEVFATLGVPQESVGDVLKLMTQNGVRTMDELMLALRSAGGGVTAQDIESIENVKTVKNYLVMIGRGDLTRLLP
jgi:hypothetical protein